MNIYEKWLGLHVVVRTFSAGIHVGTLAAAEGTAVELKDARRIWKWAGAFTLHELSQAGVTPKISRMSAPVPAILLTQAIELLPTSEDARRTFDATHE